MKAAIIERANELVVRDIPMPVVGPYDALCELLFGATCTGTDQHLIKGEFPFAFRFPTILGHESIGRVVKVGPKVRNLSPGDLVTRVGMPPTDELSVNWGGFAEYGIARDHWAMREDGIAEAEWRAYRVNQLLPPDSDPRAACDPRAATMLITWRETFSYVTRMGVGPGANVLVIGSGGNGLSFAAHAANLGAAQVTMVGSALREEQGRSAGATVYLDYKAGDLEAGLGTAGPFDFVIDAVGKRGQIDLALPYLKPGGTVGIYGIDDYGLVTVNPNRSVGTFTYCNDKYDEAEAHERVVAMWRAGKLDAGVWLDLDHPFALVDIGAAMDAVRDRRMVKALVRLSGSVRWSSTYR